MKENELEKFFPKKEVTAIYKEKDFLKHFTNLEDFISTKHPVTDKKSFCKTIYFLNKKAKILKNYFKYQKRYISEISLAGSIYDLILMYDENNFHKAMNLFLKKLKRELKNGFIIFPIHSFGMITNFKKPNRKININLKGLNISLYGQSNDIKTTIKNISDYAKKTGITKTLNTQILLDATKNYYADWLKKNPILLIDFNSKNSGYLGNRFEHQELMLIHLRVVLILIQLIYISQSKQNKEKHLLSTRMLNNSQTLDIKHYFIYQDDIQCGKNIQRIPIHSPEIQELTTLNIIDFNSNISKKSVKKIWETLKVIETKYINSYNDEKNIIYKKIFNSMEYFRRSFYNTSYLGEAVINLSLALEILLSDNYEKTIITISKIE